MFRLLPKLFLLFAFCFLILAPSASAYVAPVPATTTETDSQGNKVITPSRDSQAGDGTLQGFQKSLALPEYNKESFDYQSLTGLMNGMLTMFIGCSIDEDNDDKADYNLCPPSLQTAAIPAMGSMMVLLVASPSSTSGIEYLADIGDRLNLVSPAYAQTGYGFSVINPFLPTWRAVRNVAYLMLVIAAVGFGLAIMFRTKISPQAVITIQSALPRVILALIFITFSYAIIGLLVDSIYILFAILVWGLQIGGLYDAATAKSHFDYFSTAGFVQTTLFIMQRGFVGAWDVIRSVPEASIPLVVGGGGIIGGILKLIAVTLGRGALVAGVAPIALGLVIAVVFFFFRVLFTLAKAYLLLIIHLIFAPLFILYGMTFGTGLWAGWLRGALANILVFLFTGVVIFLTGIIIDSISRVGGNIWSPPFVGGGGALLEGMIALGAVVLLPTIPDVISQFLGVRGGLTIQLPQAGQPIQRAIGDVQNIVTRTFQPLKPGTCMPVNTLVSTPSGTVPIQSLNRGDIVWTINSSGQKIAAAIESVIKRAVSTNHKMLRITLADKRILLSSPIHPDIFGNPLNSLKCGEQLDGSYVLKMELVGYTEGFIYDLLPESETGGYWAENVLVGSTLFAEKQMLNTMPAA